MLGCSTPLTAPPTAAEAKQLYSFPTCRDKKIDPSPLNESEKKTVLKKQKLKEEENQLEHRLEEMNEQKETSETDSKRIFEQ